MRAGPGEVALERLQQRAAALPQQRGELGLGLRRAQPSQREARRGRRSGDPSSSSRPSSAAIASSGSGLRVLGGDPRPRSRSRSRRARSRSAPCGSGLRRAPGEHPLGLALGHLDRATVPGSPDQAAHPRLHPRQVVGELPELGRRLDQGPLALDRHGRGVRADAARVLPRLGGCNGPLAMSAQIDHGAISATRLSPDRQAVPEAPPPTGTRPPARAQRSPPDLGSG